MNDWDIAWPFSVPQHVIDDEAEIWSWRWAHPDDPNGALLRNLERLTDALVIARGEAATTLINIAGLSLWPLYSIGGMFQFMAPEDSMWWQYWQEQLGPIANYWPSLATIVPTTRDECQAIELLCRIEPGRLWRAVLEYAERIGAPRTDVTGM